MRPSLRLVVSVAVPVALAAIGGWARAQDRRDVVVDSARARIVAAQGALDATDLTAASNAVEAAWLYVRSPIWSSSWKGRDEARAALARELGAISAKLSAARRIPQVKSLVAAADSSLGDATRAKRPHPASFDATIEAASACERDAAEAIAAGADPEFGATFGEGLSALQAECRAIGERALAAKAEAERVAAARDAAIRALLSGDRLATYQKYGEPIGEFKDDEPATIAKAKTWIYLVGPTGALKTYERWTFVFRGDRLVTQRRTRSHETP